MAAINNVQDISIQTTTFEIKAIRVNGKAMTQAVFNQIPEWKLVDPENIHNLFTYIESGRYQEIGWVNYKLEPEIINSFDRKYIDMKGGKFISADYHALMVVDRKLVRFKLWSHVSDQLCGGNENYLKGYKIQEECKPKHEKIKHIVAASPQLYIAV